MFKHVYFGLVLGSSLLGAVGIVQSFNTSGTVQKITGIIGIGGATTALTALGLGIAYKSKEDSLEGDFKTKLEDNNKANDRQLTGLKLQIDELKSRIKSLEADKETNLKQILELQQQLNEQSKKYFQIVLDKDLQIKSLEGSLNERDTRVEDFLQESKEQAIKFFATRYEQLDDLQKRLSNGLDDDKVTLANKSLLTGRIEDIRKLKSELTDALKEIQGMEITCFNDVLAYILKFDNKFFTAKTHWKDLRRTQVETENKSLTASLRESIPRAKAVETFRLEMDQLDADITERYEQALYRSKDIHSTLMEMLEERRLKIEELTDEIVELKKPLQAIGTSEEAQTANRVSNFYYEQLGYKLDFITWNETEVGYTITYATRQNNALTNNELMVGNAKEQLARLAGALHGTFPEFEYNYQNCTVILTVIKRKLVKKDTSKTDVDRLWIPVEKFESYVKRWERIRITAGSTGGKSPTAKNLALAIMKGRKGKGEIRLYDPKHGGKKDYWNMPKAGTSHDDNWTGLTEAAKLVEARGNSTGHLFKLYIFDEVDDSVIKLQKGHEFKNAVKEILKEGSHGDIGAIFIGQSIDANEIPGMSHSNWGSGVGLHIGSNAGLAINRLETVTNEQKTKLLEKYAKIQDYCDYKNKELGLDIFTDTGAYRFALAVPLTGLPEFIQLPDFDTYDYYDVMSDSSDNHQELISSVLDEVQEQVTGIDAPMTVICPHCESSKIKKNGKDKATKTIQIYKCSDCGKGFSENDVIS